MHPGIILCLSRYPKITMIRVPVTSWNNPMSVKVTQDSADTLPRGPCHWDNPMSVRVSQDSADTIPRCPCHYMGILG